MREPRTRRGTCSSKTREAGGHHRMERESVEEREGKEDAQRIGAVASAVSRIDSMEIERRLRDGPPDLLVQETSRVNL